MGGAVAGAGWGGVKGAATLVGNALSPYPRNPEDYDNGPTQGGSSSSSGPTPPPTATVSTTLEKVQAVPPYLLDAEERAKAARQAPAFYKHLGNFAHKSIDRRKADNDLKKHGQYWSLVDTRKP